MENHNRGWRAAARETDAARQKATTKKAWPHGSGRAGGNSVAGVVAICGITSGRKEACRMEKRHNPRKDCGACSAYFISFSITSSCDSPQVRPPMPGTRTLAVAFSTFPQFAVAKGIIQGKPVYNLSITFLKPLKVRKFRQKKRPDFSFQAASCRSISYYAVFTRYGSPHRAQFGSLYCPRPGRRPFRVPCLQGTRARCCSAPNTQRPTRLHRSAHA